MAPVRKLCVATGELDIMPDGRLFAIKGDQGEDDITLFDAACRGRPGSLS